MLVFSLYVGQGAVGTGSHYRVGMDGYVFSAGYQILISDT